MTNTVDRVGDRMRVEYELPIKTSKRMQRKKNHHHHHDHHHHHHNHHHHHPRHHLLVDRGWDRMSVEYELPISSPPSEGKHGLALCDDDQVEEKVMILTIRVTMLMPFPIATTIFASNRMYSFPHIS